MTQLILSNSTIGSHSGNITKLAGESISSRHLLGKFGELESDVKICGAEDLPFGIITDEGSSGEIVNVALLGGPDTLFAVASEGICAGSILVPADGGKVKALPQPTSSSATYNTIGIALTSTASGGGIIEFVSCVPQQHTVIGIE
jgi:hypothetical protein